MIEGQPDPDPLTPPTEPPVPSAIPVARPLSFFQPQRHAIYLDRISARTAWLDIGLVILGVAAATFMMGVVVGSISAIGVEIEERMLNISLLPFQALLFSAVVLSVTKSRRLSWRSLGLTLRGWSPDYFLGLAAGASCFVAWFVSAVLIFALWQEGADQLAKNAESVMDMFPPIHPALLVGLMVIVAVYEELVFRGFLLMRLRRGLGSWWLAVIVCSALFAAPHAMDQQAVAVIPLFFIGCALSLFTIWRKSLIPAIIGHAIFNAGNVILIFMKFPEWQ